MKLILVNPLTINKTRVLRVGRCQQKVLSPVGLWPPITLLEIAAKLRKRGFLNTEVIDGETKALSFGDLIEHITVKSPDMVILQSTVPTIVDDLIFSSSLKIRLPALKTVFIGLSATTMPEELLKNEAVDYAVLGEPEDIICDLVGYHLDDSIDLSQITGLGYKSNGQSHINKRRLPLENYDYTFFPDRSLIDNEKYRLSLTNKRFTVIKTSRGCDSSCSFCTSGVYYGRGWRGRSPENIIEEIKQVKLTQGIDNFLFLSDTFNGNREFVKKLTSGIISNGLHIQWVSNSRLDLLDEESISLMKNSGCILVSLGIETFEEEILRKNNKFLMQGQIEQGINLLKKYGILTYGYFIFGLEGETRKTIWRTIIKAIHSKLDFAVFYSLTPYPGTAYFGKYNNRNWRDYFHGISGIVAYNHLNNFEIELYRLLAFFLFYIRPWRFLMLLKYFFARKLI